MQNNSILPTQNNPITQPEINQLRNQFEISQIEYQDELYQFESPYIDDEIHFQSNSYTPQRRTNSYEEQMGDKQQIIDAKNQNESRPQKVNRIQQKKQEKEWNKYEKVFKQYNQTGRHLSSLNQWYELNDNYENCILSWDFNNQYKEDQYQFQENISFQASYQVHEQSIQICQTLENNEQENQTQTNKKVGNKKDKLLNRLQDGYYHKSFNYEYELTHYFENQMTHFELDQIDTIQEFSNIKSTIVQKLQINQLDTSNGQDGFFIIQVIMLIFKYVIYKRQTYQNYGLKDINWIRRIEQDIRNAFNKEETSKALEQIYFILTDQHQTISIDWKIVIKELHYQLEVNKNFYKSHCCGYYQYYLYVENREIDPNFEKPWYELRSLYNDTNCKGGKKKFQKLNIKKIKDFTINRYLIYVLQNRQRYEKKILEIYVDDIFNLIGQYEDL